jgi:orotate phosphoribosyltransferase
MSLEQHQIDFIALLLQSKALTFGDFTTKSGRKTPYFVNMGRFDDGEKIRSLGRLYAAHVVSRNLKPDLLFGPAYKAIPLCVATAAGLSEQFGINVGFTFNRKEAKEHGDKGTMVGFPIRENSRIVLVEDVITAGTTLHEVVPLLRAVASVQLHDVVIGVDRCERGSTAQSAVQEAESTLKISIHPIVTIRQIVAHLSSTGGESAGMTPSIRTAVDGYLAQYGA